MRVLNWGKWQNWQTREHALLRLGVIRMLGTISPLTKRSFQLDAKLHSKSEL